MPHDIFICHASDDKDLVARPLAHAPEARGLTVWIDEVEVRLGDSLRQKIDEGLRTSTFGVVILSPSFFKKRWAQWELDGLADREMSSGTKVVLPVWYEVDHDDVAAHSPLLASKRAARWSDGVVHVAREVAEVLRVPAAAAPPIDRVPRTLEDEAALVRTKPGGWEYLLFAAVLRRQKEALEPKYRDHELRFAHPTYGPVMTTADASAFLSNAFAHSQALMRNVERVFDPRVLELAFGAPCEHGDAVRIEHVAQRVIDIYEGLLDWAARLRGAVVPNRFQRAVDLASSFVDGPIRQFREFVDHVVEQTDEVPALLRQEGDETIRMVFELTLSIDEGIEKQLRREMKRLPHR